MIVTPALFQCVFNDEQAQVRRFLHVGIPCNVQDFDLRSPLHIAAAEGNLSMVRKGWGGWGGWGGKACIHAYGCRRAAAPRTHGPAAVRSAVRLPWAWASSCKPPFDACTCARACAPLR